MCMVLAADVFLTLAAMLWGDAIVIDVVGVMSSSMVIVVVDVVVLVVVAWSMVVLSNS